MDTILDSSDDVASMRQFHVALSRVALEHTLLLNSLADAVLRLDSDGRIRYANPSAVRAFGLRADELQGQTFHAVAHDRPGEPADLEGCEPCRAIRDGKAFHSDEGALRKPDGATLPVECSIVPVREDERPMASVVVLRDLTEWRRSEEARRLADARAVELQQIREVMAFKSELLNATAHELNTPLTPILIQMDLLEQAIRKNAPEGDDKLRRVDIVRRNFTRFADLLHDLLEGSRLQARKIELQFASHDLADIVEDACAPFVDMANVAGVELRVEITRDLWADCDRRRMEQVVQGLLSNAIKFTLRGGHVHVRAYAAEGEVRVAIRDDGLGLEAAQVRELFQPFNQFHPGRSAGGAGLGLYIAKGIVEAHSGRVWAESDGPDRGSLFGFAIPALGRAGSSSTAASTVVPAAELRAL